MKKALPIMMMTAVLLGGCTALATAVPSSPGAIADRTVLDEKAAIGVENGYQAAVALVRAANAAGLLDQEARLRFADLDNLAYAQVQRVRQAYDAGNAASYAQAVSVAQPLIIDIFGLAPATGDAL